MLLYDATIYAPAATCPLLSCRHAAIAAAACCRHIDAYLRCHFHAIDADEAFSCFSLLLLTLHYAFTPYADMPLRAAAAMPLYFPYAAA